MKKAFMIFGMAVAVLLAATLLVRTFFTHRSFSIPGVTKTVSDDVTLSILHSEAMSFLVTRRTVTQVVIEHNESNLLGDWHGVLWATVRWHWGVDLKKITKNDIRHSGDVIYCRLPEPESLEAPAVEPGSIGFLSKSTFVPKLLELFNSGHQQRTVEMLLQQRANEFATEKKLKPTREEMLIDANNAVKVFKDTAGIDLRFE